MEVTIQLDPSHRQLELFGPADSHLRFLRQSLGVKITARQSNLIVVGEEENVNRAADIIDKMQKHLIKHHSLSTVDISAFINQEGSQPRTSTGLLTAQTTEGAHPARDGLEETQSITVYAQKKVIEPSTAGQLRYIEAMLVNDITFCIGPAGTGKTYLAVAIAVSMLKKKQIRRIVLARPAVEAGEKLGFLPGDIQAKVNPYLRPLFDALEDMMDFTQMKKFMELDIIEIIPLAFMRGRTLNEAAIICDEAQNTSSLQMLMVLTRLGHGSKMIITGDITQIDLESHQQSGMVEAIELLRRIKGIGVIELTRKDIVRHRLVQNIVRAYKKRNNKFKARNPKQIQMTKIKNTKQGE
jgi:phosphate starvation-inducible PhoH-like protein